MSENVVMLIGNLGSDGELKVTQGGNAVLKLSVATSESWKDQRTGEKKEKTQWHRVDYWGKGAEGIAQYMTKGKTVFIQGSIEYQSYEKDGEKKYTTIIKAHRVSFVGKSDGGRNASTDEPDTTNDAQEPAPFG